MLYKYLVDPDYDERFDRPNISVRPLDDSLEPQVRELLLSHLPKYFFGIDSTWVDALFRGYRRRDTKDVNLKYKLIYVAIDRDNRVLGVAGATPKKSGRPIKIMPFIATTLPAFVALLTDVPNYLKQYGNKLYIHITPSVDETIALQQRGWKLDAAMPKAYHDEHITQQWSIDVQSEKFMSFKFMRVKQDFLDMIRSGRKTLEVRTAYGIVNSIQTGDLVKLASRNDEIIVRIVDVRRYSSIAAMIEKEDAGRIAPGSSAEGVVRLLRRFYPPKFEKDGIIVLDMRVEKAL